MNRFVGYFQVLTTLNYNTLNIPITITYEKMSSTLQLFSCLLNSLRLTASQVRLNISHNYSSESESYVTTDSQSASLSWNKAPIWGLWPDFYYCQTVAGLLMWGAVSGERTGLLFKIAAGPCQHSHSRIRVPWDSRPYFTVSDLRLPFSSPPITRKENHIQITHYNSLSVVICISVATVINVFIPK
jgi:hypothetical protein